MGKTKAFLLFAVMLLASCSSHEKVAGGNATETTNGFKISIIDKSGKPAARARAFIRPATYVQGDDPSCCQTVSASAQGVITFDSVPVGQWRVEITDASGALFYEYNRSAQDSFADLGTDTLKQFSKMVGKIPTPFASNTRIEVLGTDRICYPDSYGNFSFDSMPAGVHVVQSSTAQDTLRGYVTVNEGTTDTVGILVQESSQYLLLDDFEDGDSQHRFAPISGQGWWYQSSSLGVTVTPSGEAPVPLDTTDPIHYSAIHFTVKVDSGSYPWANCGVQLGKQNQSYDLSSVDSLVFWAKGVGDLQVGLVLQAHVTSISDMHADITLTPDWYRFSIPLDTIRAGELVDPPAARAQTLGLIWQMSADGEIWLDEVTLIGASREEVWGR